jgi:hypothetical protein
VKPSYQQLVFESEVVQDFESVADLIEREPRHVGGTLLVTVITAQSPFPTGRTAAIQALVTRLTSSDSQRRSGAIAKLAKVIDVVDRRELDCFVREVREQTILGSDVASKRSGLEALATVCPKGHDDSIKVALRCIDDRSEFVRLTAIQTLSALAPRGHEDTIQSAKRLLRSDLPAKRSAGLMVLGEVGKEDNPSVMDLLSKFSDDKDIEICMAANEAVTSIIRCN